MTDANVSVSAHINETRIVELGADVVSAVVTDGVTVGHPCCNEHNCKVPLRKIYDEFCPVHYFRNSTCGVANCRNPRVPGFRTCNRREHRAEEERRAHRGRKVRKGLGTNRGGASETRRLDKVSGVFSRRWTHNEQLMVWPCGIVIARATFFGAEAVSAVKVCCLLLLKSLLTMETALGILRQHLPYRLSGSGTRLSLFRQRMQSTLVHKKQTNDRFSRSSRNSRRCVSFSRT